MNTKIDLKSALCGLAVGILAMLAIGAAPSSGAVGKYQVASNGAYVAIIDTTTGRAWGANISYLNAVHAGFWDPKEDK